MYNYGSDAQKVVLIYVQRMRRMRVTVTVFLFASLRLMGRASHDPKRWSSII
jgi:hypothetical protein